MASEWAKASKVGNQQGGLVGSGVAGKTPSTFSGLPPTPSQVCTRLPFQGGVRPKEEKLNVGAGPAALPGDLTYSDCFGLAMPGVDRGPRVDCTHKWPQWGSPTLPSRWPAWPSQL